MSGREIVSVIYGLFGWLGLFSFFALTWDIGSPRLRKMEARIRALEAVTCEQHPEPAAPETCACAGETP